VLRTGRAGVVTEPDLRLARRIDQVVTDIASGGRPG
jgi:pterin-4a-carbinolamine dehydratase